MPRLRMRLYVSTENATSSSAARARAGGMRCASANLKRLQVWPRAGATKIRSRAAAVAGDAQVPWPRDLHGRFDFVVGHDGHIRARARSPAVTGDVQLQQ